MPANFYGDGGLYGTGLDYGRIAASLATAQASRVRETALKASIIDERVNRWEKFTGLQKFSGTDFRDLGGDSTTQTNTYYRQQMDVTELPNGDIVRVRVGDNNTLTDFNIYIQTITDPTNATQWNTWSLLYSGTHFAVAIASEADSSYHVYTSKVNGLYRDNVLQWSQPNIIAIEPVMNTFDAMFISVVDQDPHTDHPSRLSLLYYTEDIVNVTPYRDPMNYRWSDFGSIALLLDDDSVLRFNIMPRYDPRAPNNGDSITVGTMPAIDDNDPSELRLVRGLGGEVGHNILRGMALSEGKLSDGYYYLFYGEAHADNDFESTTNPGQGTKWQRSKDGLHWSEPVTAGITAGGKTVLEHSGYVWYPGFDEVWRRPATSVVYDITNYVPQVQFEIPRDNQEGNGELLVANPSGINDIIKNLSDRRLILEVGLKTDTGAYEYVQFNDWWIKRTVQEVEGNANRIKVPFGDIWTRLGSSLPDTFNFIGKLKWNDWAPTRRNKSFNYFFVTDTAPVDTTGNLKTKGIVLYAGLKCQNATVQAHFSSVTGNPAIIFRYIDPKNYQRIEKSGSILTLYDRVNGVDTEIDNGACSSDTSPTLKLVFRFEKYWAYVNDVLIFSGTYEDQPNVSMGYVGFGGSSYTISNFYLEDWEVVINAQELIKTALAMGDYHDVVTGESTAEELNIVWGPQTDIPTPADGLRQALEAVKWDLVWNDGRIRVGSFSGETPGRTLQDEIIRTDYVDEANRRINQANVDGNEDTWIETDVVDTQQRDRQISSYFDLPELTDQDSVTARAQEEIRKGKMGRTPGGMVPLLFDLWRMDVITWIDNVGNSTVVRVEGISAEIEQGLKPSQRETVDTSALL